MFEIHLRQPLDLVNLDFHIALVDYLQKTKKEYKNQEIKESGNSRYIYQNELERACLHHDMACGNFKDLPRKTTLDKVLLYKAFDAAKNWSCFNSL